MTNLCLILAFLSAMPPTPQTVISGGGIISGGHTISYPLHSVSLAWDASTSPNVVGYGIYRSTTSGGPYVQVNSALIPGTTFTDTSVAAGQTYFYAATAVDSSGNESVVSNEVMAIVPGVSR